MPYIIRANRRYTVTEDQFQRMQWESLDNGNTLRRQDAEIAARVLRGDIPEPGMLPPGGVGTTVARRLGEMAQARLEEQRRMTEGFRAAQIQAGTPFFNQEYQNPYPPKEEVQMTDEQFPQLTFPLVAETDGEGVKRLYKTRYTELERMYSALYAKARKLSQLQEFYHREMNTARTAHMNILEKYTKLEDASVDSAVVVKRMEQVAKEIGIGLGNPRQTMEEKLNTFFGALMTRIRCEEMPDELAD